MAFEIRTEDRLTTVDVTDRVADSVPADADGVCHVFVEHTTAGVVVNEAESRLRADLEDFLSDAVADEGWGHDEIDDNADSHLRAMLLGNDVAIPVSDGDLSLGTWQSVLFVECDGPRTRRVRVTTT